MNAPLNIAGGEVLACELDNECEVLSCEVCLAEIPASVAASTEGNEYIQHYCGLDCLEALAALQQGIE